MISTENLTHKQPKVRKRNSLAVSSSKRQDIEEIARVVNERESQNEEAQNEGENQNEEENLNDEVSDNESMKTHTESSNSFDENFESNPYISQVYQLNDLKIVNNKIVTTKQNIKYSAWFEYFIITVIILNSLALILDNPLQDPNGPLSKTLKYLDIIFTIIFTIEACMKIIALGFFWNNFPGISGYILNGWNMLDFVIVCASLVDLGFSLSSSSQNTGNLKSLKALRAFRALRPLRVISRNEGLQIVVNTLFASVPAMTNVFMVMILLLIIFSIMGVNFFKGEFYQCTFDDSYTASQVKAILERVIHKDDCIAEGGSWVNSDQNFDNVFVSLLTLFQMMSTEGWTNVMYNGMDSKGVNLQPKQNNGPWYSIYFILFMIVGFLFLMNLFVGVIIDNFNKIKEQKDVGGIFVTDSQRNWIEIQHLMLAKTLLRKKYPPQGKFRRFFYDVQDSKYFEGFIITCIFMNTIIMAMQYARMDHDYGLSIEAINYVFSFIFNVEMVIKLIAL